MRGLAESLLAEPSAARVLQGTDAAPAQDLADPQMDRWNTSEAPGLVLPLGQPLPPYASLEEELGSYRTLSILSWNTREAPGLILPLGLPLLPYASLEGI